MKTTQKPGTKFCNGIPLSIPNEVMENDPTFYVSYNSSSSGYGCATTALVRNDPQMSHFYILKGDHREQYKAESSLAKCLEYYKLNEALRHEYSDKLAH